MRSRIVSLAILYIKSTFSLSLPSRKELKNPKKLAKTIGIGIGILLILADVGFMFVMMNMTMYEGLKPAGMQGLMLLNASITASVLVFIMAFMMALSMFSQSGIESGFLVLPFSSRELLAAKMFLVYFAEALMGVFVMAIAIVIYGIKEAPPFMFYVNGLVTAFALPLLPTAISYLILVPLMNASRLFRSKNFIIYLGGFLGMGFALAFNFYIQSAMTKIGAPASLALYVDSGSLISRLGQAWLPSWLAWKALSEASNIGGPMAVLGNLAIGLAGCAVVVVLLGNSYTRSLRSFNESTFSKKKLSMDGKGREGRRTFAQKPLMRSLVAREIRLMNREPMYLLNGPFVMILMPALLAVVYLAQRETLSEAMKSLGPMLTGPGAYLIPAAFGGFLGSSSSITCTAVSRDAKALPWIKSMPIKPTLYFAAKLLHAELFAVLGAFIGCGAGILLFGIGALDSLIALLLALLFSAALNMAGLWLDVTWPRLRWDNPLAAMKQNPNSSIAILATMGLIGGLSGLSAVIALPRYAYAMIFGAVFTIPILVWVKFFPKYAAKRYKDMEA